MRDDSMNPLNGFGRDRPAGSPTSLMTTRHIALRTARCTLAAEPRLGGSAGEG
ncbi:MAG: hypothetical protein JF564_00955 [Sphingomonas sp.]|nr:hypothetical protein [Sphingomonas sp.]